MNCGTVFWNRLWGALLILLFLVGIITYGLVTKYEILKLK